MITLLIDSELRYPLDDTVLAQLLDEVGVEPAPAGLEMMIERWMKTSAVVWLPLVDGGRVAVSWRAVRTAQVLHVVPGEVVAGEQALPVDPDVTLAGGWARLAEANRVRTTVDALMDRQW